MGQLEDFRASLKRKDSGVSIEGEIPIKNVSKAKQEKMKRRTLGVSGELHLELKALSEYSVSLVIFIDHFKYHRQREVDADRFAVDLLMNEELPDYKAVLAIVLLPVSYTLRVLVRQFQCQVCIDYDLATYLTDCRTDPFAVLDSPRRGRAAAEEGLYSFKAIDQVLLLHRHFLHILPRLHFKVFLHCHLHCHHRIASTFTSSQHH